VTGPDEGILTLEPLIEAVRQAVETAGWELSGLQKTTSHQFEGRWQGDSTRSAYLFFHLPDGPDHVSVDVYLDETSRGLTGNLALVVDLVPLGDIGDVRDALESLATPSALYVHERHRRPVTVRLRLADAAEPLDEAGIEVRFKVRLGKATVAAGAEPVSDFTAEVLESFQKVLASEQLERFVSHDR